jgi:hypothetical protein
VPVLTPVRDAPSPVDGVAQQDSAAVKGGESREIVFRKNFLEIVGCEGDIFRKMGFKGVSGDRGM